ncbi:MAG: DUF4390 domain-containing protein [Thioalkalispiraceae bacterium]
MDFITHLYIRLANFRLTSVLTKLSLASLLACLSLPALGDAFTIRTVQTKLMDKVYTLSAQIEYQFSEAAIEALENGVPLIVLIDIEVERERNWWLDEEVAELQQGYLLLYHALTEKYIVNNLNSGAQVNYDTLHGAVAGLGEISNLPILDANLASSDARYVVRLHTYLDLEALPAPMRPVAYISSQWRLESDWYEWPLQP